MKKLFAPVTFAFCLPFNVFGAVFAYVIFVVAGIFGRNALHNARRLVHYIWNRAVVYSTLSKVCVHGAERIPRDSPVVVYSNHSSFFDIPILSGFVLPEAVYIARHGLVLSPVIKAAGGALIEQRGNRKELQIIREVVAKIKQGSSFIIFPEGTRTRDGQLGELKRGSIKIAQWAGVPALPVRIEGSLELLPRWRVWPRSTCISVYIGEPISANQMSSESSEIFDRIERFIGGK